MTAAGESGYKNIARVMAEAVRAGAGDGWSAATLQVQHTAWGWTFSAWSDARDRIGVDPLLVYRTMPDAPHMSVEVCLRDTGEYAFAACSDVDLLTPERVVFDPEFRYPGHPSPGMPRPPSAEPTGADTDPDVLAEITGLADEFAELYTTIKGYPPPWVTPCTEEDLAAAESRIGARLPEDLRALYRVTNGDPDESGLLGRYGHYQLEQVVEYYVTGPPGSYGWEDDLSDDGVVFETVPFGSVKCLSRNDWWITFGTDCAMNYLAVDLDPADHGYAGQVIEYGRDIYGPVRYVARSITDMLSEVVAALRAGNFENCDEHILDIEVGFAEDHPRAYSAIASCKPESDVPAVLAAVPEPELVQQLSLNDPGDVDLATLEGFRSLRMLSVNRAQTVIPSISQLNMLESLQVDGRGIEPAALAEHRTLWSLRLEGITDPVDLAPLRTLRRLTRLDIAGSAIPQLQQLREIPSLRVLRVDPVQAKRLLDGNQSLPQLAALFVAGNVHLREAADLATALSGGRGHVALTEFKDEL